MDDGTPLARERRSEAASRASGRLKRFAAVATVLACVGTAVAFYSQQGFALDPRMLRARIEDFGWLAPAVYVVAAALRPFLILPSWVVMSAGGLLFGVWGGIAWGSVGFSLGALLAFSLARALGRDAVSSRLGGRAADLLAVAHLHHALAVAGFDRSELLGGLVGSDTGNTNGGNKREKRYADNLSSHSWAR